MTEATDDGTLFDAALARAATLSALVDRIARHDALLAEYTTTAGSFVDNLSADELVFFLESTPRQLRPAVKRWLAYRATSPSASYLDRTIHLQHAWQERYKTGTRQKTSRLPIPEQFLQRLRAAGLVRNERICFGPYDSPSAPLDVFLSWVSEEAAAWALSMTDRSFQAVCRSWLEWHWVHHYYSGGIRGSGDPRQELTPGSYQRIFVGSKQYDEAAEARLYEEDARWHESV